MTTLAINRETISSNYNRLRSYIRKTPVLQVTPAAFGCGGTELHLKLEYLQNTGSFKARGALTNFLSGTLPDAGVVAASGGNHGIAVAYAAKEFQTFGAIFVPESAPSAKTSAIERHGAALFRKGHSYADAFEAAQAYAHQSGAKLIHAYDQAETLVGQGSVGLEFESQTPGLSTLLVAVGGGGLIGGIAAWYQGRIKLIAVEPETCPTLKSATDAGEPVDVEVSGVASDSLGARRVGAIAFPLCQSFVEDTVTVTDAAIEHARALLWDRARILSEPGGATALAALTSGAYTPGENERVGVLVCGANTSALPGPIA